jgi:rhodanese-related sulfurtransferase
MQNKRRKAAPKKGFPIWVIGLLVITMLVVVGVIVVLSQPQPQAAVTSLPSEITVAQAAEMQKNGAFVLDVREPSEWAAAHIQGATLIPLGSLASRLNEVPKNRQVVVYCHSGNRSAQGRDILKNAGYTLVTSMAGGITQWQAQGMPVIAGQ